MKRLLVALVFVVSACGPDDPPQVCERGKWQRCSCTLGYDGAQYCFGAYWGPCDCWRPEDAGEDSR